MEHYWARLKAESPYPLRRGAWYQVAEFQRHDVVLEVHWTPVAVPRSFIEIVEKRPEHWTVVPRPRNAARMPESWGDEYGVCPNCGHRVSLAGALEEMLCGRCEESFLVAWSESYLGRRANVNGRAED
jgi:hypothetical protein